MPDQILIIIGVTFLVLISPGPDMVIVIRNTLVGGRSAGYKTSFGILAGNFVHVTYCVAGIGWLIANSIVAFGVLKLAGAAYLIFLGFSSFRHNDMTRTASIDAHQLSRTWFVQGFFNNVLNPKGTLFFLGVFTTVITPDTPVETTIMLVAIMLLMCALFWVTLVLTLETSGVRRFIERSQNVVQRVFGVVLISLGLRVAFLSR